jgi:uncharacterized RDD family membrane protein YckC
MANWQAWRTVSAPPPMPPPPPVAGPTAFEGTTLNAAPIDASPVDSIPAASTPSAGAADSYSAGPYAGPAGGTALCAVCGQLFPDSQLVMVGSSLACAQCKPVALQRLQQGTWTRSNRRYAGFWIRFAAVFIDNLILGVAGAVITIPLGLGIPTDGGIESIVGIFASIGVSSAINTALAVAYYAYFLSQNGATPGKMVFGLQVIRSDGSRLTPGRAIGRYFAQLLSAMILLIGYIIAAFDAEKRALHDHICDTRVVYKN